MAKNEAGQPPRRPPAKPAILEGDEGGDRAPDFLGLSLREAVEKARAENLKVKMHGYGRVYKQHPLPGAAWTGEQELILNLQG
jgi:hypothetical protein